MPADPATVLAALHRAWCDAEGITPGPRGQPKDAVERAFIWLAVHWPVAVEESGDGVA